MQNRSVCLLNTSRTFIASILKRRWNVPFAEHFHVHDDAGYEGRWRWRRWKILDSLQELIQVWRKVNSSRCTKSSLNTPVPWNIPIVELKCRNVFLLYHNRKIGTQFVISEIADLDCARLRKLKTFGTMSAMSYEILAKCTNTQHGWQNSHSYL